MSTRRESSVENLHILITELQHLKLLGCASGTLSTVLCVAISPGAVNRVRHMVGAP